MKSTKLCPFFDTTVKEARPAIVNNTCGLAMQNAHRCEQRKYMFIEGSMMHLASVKLDNFLMDKS